MTISAIIPVRNYDCERRKKEDSRRKLNAKHFAAYAHQVDQYQNLQIRMIVTPWFVDPLDGLQTRVIRAAE